MAFIFEKLNVYQKALDFTDRVANITESFARGIFAYMDLSALKS